MIGYIRKTFSPIYIYIYRERERERGSIEGECSHNKGVESWQFKTFQSLKLKTNFLNCHNLECGSVCVRFRKVAL